MTALHWAVSNDDAEMAGLLVRSRANVNAANRYGVPPLSIACTNGNAPWSGCSSTLAPTRTPRFQVERPFS